MGMFRTTSAVLAIVVAASASAGWRGLAIDGSTEANFVQSVATLKQELSRARGIQLDRALNEVWIQGTLDGIRDGRAFTADDYFAKLDGLGFKDILDVADATGDKRDVWRAEAEVQAHGYNARFDVIPPRVNTPGNGPTYNMGTQSAGGAWNSPENVSAMQGR
jgi:hypothetical protein